MKAEKSGRKQDCDFQRGVNMGEVLAKRFAGPPEYRLSDDAIKDYYFKILYFIRGDRVTNFTYQVVYIIKGDTVQDFYYKYLYKFDGRYLRDFYGKVRLQVRDHFICDFYGKELYDLDGMPSRTTLIAFMCMLLDTGKV